MRLLEREGYDMEELKDASYYDIVEDDEIHWYLKGTINALYFSRAEEERTAIVPFRDLYSEDGSKKLVEINLMRDKTVLYPKL